MLRRLCLLLLPVVLLAGCQPDDKSTLRVWDTYTGERQSAAMDAQISRYHEAHPNVTIVRTSQAVERMRESVRLLLGTDSGPDVLNYDTGPAYAGALAKAGLLAPLDGAYQRYDWSRRFFPWTKDRVTFGTKVYGIGNEIEFLGVYYNKKIFAQLNLDEPKTYDEFLLLCDKINSAGYTPIAFADAARWPAFHQFSLLANNVVGQAKLENMLFAGSSWDTPAVVQSIRMFFVDMNRAGYFLKNPNLLSYEDGNAAFYKGKAAMQMTGSWLLSEMETRPQGFEAGYFLFPSVDGKPVLPPGGLGSGYFVASNTKFPKQAEAFLDDLFSQQNGAFWLEDMALIPPLPVEVGKLKLSPLMKDALTTFSVVPLGYNIDVLAGTRFNAVQSAGYQAVLQGLETPEELARDLQIAWQQDQAQP